MSLKQNHKKIKSLGRLGGIGLIILLSVLLLYQVVFISTKLNLGAGNIEIEKSQIVAATLNDIQKNSQKFYIAASKSGKKYYYPGCAGLNRIKPENLVFFESEKAAEGRGLSLAKNCFKP